MKKNRIKSQTGRSMVEMLGVLAIIGVLSVGGIVGYRSAMDRHIANEIQNDMQIAWIEFMNRFHTGWDPSKDFDSISGDVALEYTGATNSNNEPLLFYLNIPQDEFEKACPYLNFSEIPIRAIDGCSCSDNADIYDFQKSMFNCEKFLSNGCDSTCTRIWIN